MTITLPDDVRAQAEERAKAGGFASVDEYVADLVREDVTEYPDEPSPGRGFDTREELGRLLDETLGSPVLRMDEQFWQELDEQIAAAERGKAS
jgi:Arc/MetJ-type ribon-helix-helix transcriptional regulator